MIYDTELNIGDETYEVVAAAGDYGWFWAEAALLRRDGQLYYAYSLGCSCYGFADNVSASDLKPVANWQQAVELAKEDLEAQYAVTFAERLAEKRPTPSPGRGDLG